MELDWFTVAAQIINFLILVWLLKRFLYRPVVAAMDKREARIASRLAEAEGKVRQAEAEKERYVGLQEDLRREAEAAMVLAREEAQVFREQLMARIRDEVAEQRRRWFAELDREKASFLSEASRMVGRHFEELARNALRDLADAALEERMIGVLLARLPEAAKNEREAIAKAVLGQGQPVLVTTAHPADGERVQRINTVVQNLWPGATVTFAQDADLMAGITIEAGGKQIRWDIRHYLDRFHDGLAAALEREAKVE